MDKVMRKSTCKNVISKATFGGLYFDRNYGGYYHPRDISSIGGANIMGRPDEARVTAAAS